MMATRPGDVWPHLPARSRRDGCEVGNQPVGGHSSRLNIRGAAAVVLPDDEKRSPVPDHGWKRLIPRPCADGNAGWIQHLSSTGNARGEDVAGAVARVVPNDQMQTSIGG